MNVAKDKTNFRSERSMGFVTNISFSRALCKTYFIERNTYAAVTSGDG